MWTRTASSGGDHLEENVVTSKLRPHSASHRNPDPIAHRGAALFCGCSPSRWVWRARWAGLRASSSLRPLMVPGQFPSALKYSASKGNWNYGRANRSEGSCH